MALAMRFDEGLHLLNQIQLDIRAEHPPETSSLECECTTIRSVTLALQDDSVSALSLAADCLSRSNDPWTANVASNVIRLGHLKAGDLTRFYGTPWIPYSLDEDRRNLFASVYRRCLQGLAEVQQVRFAAAERYYRDGSALAEQHVGANSVAVGLPLSLLAHIRYEQGRIDEAESMVWDRIPILGATAMLECVLSAYFVLVRAAALRANLSHAYALLEQAENLGLSRHWSRLVATALAERARLACLESGIGEAVACLARIESIAEERPAPTLCAWSDIHRYAAWTRARIAASQGRLQEAISILKALQHETEEAHNNYFSVRVGIHLATVQSRANQQAEAVLGFRRLLNMGAQTGLRQSILDEGLEIGPLLAIVQQTPARDTDSRGFTSYVGSLAEGWRARYQAQSLSGSTFAIAEGLSAREGDILKLIAQGHSNKEIARALAIAPETVKSHVKHIFVKLNVEKRAQAVSRALSLGLVGTP